VDQVVEVTELLQEQEAPEQQTRAAAAEEVIQERHLAEPAAPAL
jgi:hypothetical protein